MLLLKLTTPHLIEAIASANILIIRMKVSHDARGNLLHSVDIQATSSPTTPNFDGSEKSQTSTANPRVVRIPRQPLPKTTPNYMNILDQQWRYWWRFRATLRSGWQKNAGKTKRKLEGRSCPYKMQPRSSPPHKIQGAAQEKFSFAPIIYITRLMRLEESSKAPRVQADELLRA